MDQFDSTDVNYFRIIKNNITPLDLFIISKLNEGLSLNQVVTLTEKEFDIKNAKKTVEERFNKLLSEQNPERSIILQSNPQYLINPAKLYNTISMIFIKANLDTLEKTSIDISIQNVFDTIMNMNNKPKFGKPIKQLYTITGWMFDFIGIIYVNNMERFHRFRNYLINEGIAKKVDIVPINIDSGFLFNPISSPDYNDVKHFLIHYHNRMDRMMDELKANDINSTKTMRFFDKDEYVLKVLSGKHKGEMYPIDTNEIKIGRYYDNDIILQDIDISRRHAKITKIGNKHIFKDRSTNGTYVNDKLIVYDEIELQNDDVIKIGKNKFRFQKKKQNKNS